MYMGAYIDFGFINFKDYKKKKLRYWSRWDMSYAIILYDKTKQLNKLIKEKTKLSVEENQEILEEFWPKVWWYPWLPESFWFKRGDLVMAHGILNDAIKGMLEVLFLLNKEYIVYDKWIYNMYKSLPEIPNWFHKDLKRAMIIKEFTKKDVERRSKILKKMANFVMDKYQESRFTPEGEDKVIEYILKRKKFTLKDFEKKFPLDKGLLIRDPFARITKRYKKGKDIIIELDLDLAKNLEKGYEFLPWIIPLLKKFKINV